MSRNGADPAVWARLVLPASAHGIHKGGLGNDAYFMAQNYMHVLNIRVKVL